MVNICGKWKWKISISIGQGLDCKIWCVRNLSNVLRTSIKKYIIKVLNLKRQHHHNFIYIIIFSFDHSQMDYFELKLTFIWTKNEKKTLKVIYILNMK